MKRWDGYICGWMTRGTGESIFDAAEWCDPQGRRGQRRSPLWIILLYPFVEFVCKLLEKGQEMIKRWWRRIVLRFRMWQLKVEAYNKYSVEAKLLERERRAKG